MNLLSYLHTIAGYGLNFPYEETWITWLFDNEIEITKRELHKKYWCYND